ncbi:MAG: hypothetical protein J0G96_07330 [Flavobacteriia bacterium]|nr:hypothetical protein [Flavobacteriia bacterium]OJX36678.1 MAG: hypothetical protein BGO87_12840 [Flavobacteriia bacterium 40-80]
MKTKKKNARRYYLHHRLRKSIPEVRLKTRERTLFVGVSLQEHAQENKYVKQLLQLGYSLQTEIE